MARRPGLRGRGALLDGPANGGLGPICDDNPYPRYAPGTYDVLCCRAKLYRDPRFRCWKCRLDCQFLTEPDTVSGFLISGLTINRMRSRLRVSACLGHGE